MGSRVPRGPRTGGPAPGRHRPGVARSAGAGGSSHRGLRGGGPDRRMIGPHVTNSWPATASLTPLACPFFSFCPCGRVRAISSERGEKLEKILLLHPRATLMYVVEKNYSLPPFQKKYVNLISREVKQF